MKKLLVTLIGVLISFTASAEGEYRLMVLGEGDIKSMTTGLGNTVWSDEDESILVRPQVVSKIPGGYECKVDRVCYIMPLFDLILKINGKDYYIKNFYGAAVQFREVILDSQSRENSKHRFAEISSSYLKSFYAVNKGHITVDVKGRDGKFFKYCYKTEAELTVESTTDVIADVNYKNIVVACP